MRHNFSGHTKRSCGVNSCKPQCLDSTWLWSGYCWHTWEIWRKVFKCIIYDNYCFNIIKAFTSTFDSFRSRNGKKTWERPLRNRIISINCNVTDNIRLLKKLIPIRPKLIIGNYKIARYHQFGFAIIMQLCINYAKKQTSQTFSWTPESIFCFFLVIEKIFERVRDIILLYKIM